MFCSWEQLNLHLCESQGALRLGRRDLRCFFHFSAVPPQLHYFSCPCNSFLICTRSVDCFPLHEKVVKIKREATFTTRGQWLVHEHLFRVRHDYHWSHRSGHGEKVSLTISTMASNYFIILWDVCSYFSSTKFYPRRCKNTSTSKVPAPKV